MNQGNRGGMGLNRGFTLLEVLIGFTILSVGMLAVGTLQLRSINSNDLSGSGTEALNLAQRYMEEILNAPYTVGGVLNPRIADRNPANNDHLTSATAGEGGGGGAGDADYFNVDVNGEAVNLGKYNLICNIAEGVPLENTKSVVVILSWYNGKRKVLLSCVKSMAD